MTIKYATPGHVALSHRYERSVLRLSPSIIDSPLSYLLCTYYVSGTFLDAGNIAMNERQIPSLNDLTSSQSTNQPTNQPIRNTDPTKKTHCAQFR